MFLDFLENYYIMMSKFIVCSDFCGNGAFSDETRRTVLLNKGIG